jgi:heme-degrading monooxygenase HmoA
MAVVRINAITVAPEGGDELLERFRDRLGSVDDQPGFLGFELLAPTSEAERRWFVVTHWETTEDFDAWMQSTYFKEGHARSERRPVGTAADLLEFDVVLSSKPAG